MADLDKKKEKNEMTDINRAGKTVVVFLKEALGVEGVKVVKATKTGAGWESEAEVFEDSAFIKSLGLPTRVRDRNIYLVRLSDDLEVESYERKEQ